MPLYLDEFGNGNKRPVFYTEIINETAGQTRVNVYCTDSAYTDLTENKQIKDGVGGSSTIQFTKLDNGQFEITHEFTDDNIIEAYNENEESTQRMLKAIEKSWSFDGIKDVSYGFKVIFNSEQS